jgi:hypothetical protein
VGAVDVDARSGDLLLDSSAQQGIVQHARRLYAGATLQVVNPIRGCHSAVGHTTHQKIAPC